MSKNIAAIFKANPKSRVVAFTGSNHGAKTAQPKILMTEDGIASKSYKTVYPDL